MPEPVGMTSVCPARALAESEAVAFLRMWTHHKRGLLPVSGGVMDQPTVLMAALEFYDNAAA